MRLWRAEQTAALEAFAPPEILEADLTGLVLDCAAWGVSDPASLAFLDAPPAPAIKEAKMPSGKSRRTRTRTIVSRQWAMKCVRWLCLPALPIWC